MAAAPRAARLTIREIMSETPVASHANGAGSSRFGNFHPHLAAAQAKAAAAYKQGELSLAGTEQK